MTTPHIPEFEADGQPPTALAAAWAKARGHPWSRAAMVGVVGAALGAGFGAWQRRSASKRTREVEAALSLVPPPLAWLRADAALGVPYAHLRERFRTLAPAHIDEAGVYLDVIARCFAQTMADREMTVDPELEAQPARRALRDTIRRAFVLIDATLERQMRPDAYTPRQAYEATQGTGDLVREIAAFGEAYSSIVKTVLQYKHAMLLHFSEVSNAKAAQDTTLPPLMALPATATDVARAAAREARQTARGRRAPPPAVVDWDPAS